MMANQLPWSKGGYFETVARWPTDPCDVLGQHASSVRTWAYDAAGRVVSSTDEEGRVTVYGYDGDGRLVSVTDPAGLVTSTSYTAGGKVGSVTAPDGTTTSYTYDPYGRQASVTTVDGTTATTYKPSGLVDRVTDARGVDSVYTYSAAGRVQQITVNGDRHTVYGYDAAGRERSVTHPGGRTESVILDGDGLVVSYQSPTGLITETTLDDAGRPVVVSDPGGVATTTTYDPRGMVASVTRSGEGPVTYSYDNAGQLVGATDANGNTTSYTPDSRGRTVRVTDPTGAHQDTGFDHSGRVISSTDPLGRQSVTDYDTGGRVANVVDPSGRATTYGYDTAGRVSGWTATNTATAEVLAATFAYDPVSSRLVTETVGGRTWTNTYDSHGDLTGRVNPDGRRLGWSYDGLGRVSTVTGVDGLRRGFSYDQADQITSVTSGQKVADTFTGADGDGLDPAKWTTSTSGGGTVSVGSNTARLAVTTINGSRAQFSYKGEPRDLTDTTFTVDLSGAGASSRLLVYNRFVDDANYDLVEFRPGANKATISRAGLWWNNTLGTVGVPTSGGFKVRVATSQNWVQIKVWPVDQAEPAAWGVSFNDFLPFFWGTPKWVAVGGTNAAGDIRVDDVSIAAAGTDTLAAYNYDPDGRLTTTATDSVVSAGGLDPFGLPETITGPDGTSYADWVPGGELVSLTRPGQWIGTLTHPAGDFDL